MTPAKTNPKTLYATDYLKWIETTTAKLRDRDYDGIDWENLIEELDDMGRSERRSLKSNVIVILLHLLKWQFQPEYRTGSWEGSIIEHRGRVRDLLKDSPSLVPYLETILSECYGRAVEQAKAETRLPIATFPEFCPYAIDQIIEDRFLPK